MFKKFLALSLALASAIGFIGCDRGSKLPQYADKQFEISGFWAPYEMTEESFKQYKDVGFTTFAMINHSLSRTSENQFYLGSDRTMTALELCKKVGLKAVLNYNDWIAESCEEEGEAYYGETPFSKHDIYGEYKDIITGIHIVDEPYVKRDSGSNHFEIYGNKTLIEDFKKVYPNAEYIVNLIPMTALSSRGFTTYEEMMDLVEKTFMEPFDNPYVSVDVYPFHEGMTTDDLTLLKNYRYIADSAKKYGVKPAYILQSSVGGTVNVQPSDEEVRKEFEMRLSESDLRWEVYNALLFGADTLQYYCYAVPTSYDQEGNVVSYMYDNCILNHDGTPSEVYYSLQKIHKEIQSYANVILSYDWQKTIGISGSEKTTYRVGDVQYDDNLNIIELENTKNYVEAQSTRDTVIGHFTSEKYGDAYMLHNWADRDDTNTVTVTFKDCSSVAIYGGAGFEGTPEIAKLTADGKLTIELEYGEGVFITPIR